MNIRKLSINKACVFLGVFLLLAAGFISAAVYVLTRNTTAVWYVLLFSLFVLLCVICFVALIRRKLAHFSDAFCAMLDDMLSGAEQPRQAAEEESLFYKINFRLGRLYEVMQENKNSITKEQSDLPGIDFRHLPPGKNTDCKSENNQQHPNGAGRSGAEAKGISGGAGRPA